MNVWSKALPLTASCPSPLSGFEYNPGHIRKLPVTWGYGVVFTKYSCFLHQLKLASRNMQKTQQKRNSIHIPVDS